MFQGEIREHMEVIGAHGGHVGVVDRVEGERLKLTRNDPAAGGTHHYVSVGLVAGVEGDKVRLSVATENVPQLWEGEAGGAP